MLKLTKSEVEQILQENGAKAEVILTSNSIVLTMDEHIVTIVPYVKKMAIVIPYNGDVRCVTSNYQVLFEKSDYNIAMLYNISLPWWAWTKPVLQQICEKSEFAKLTNSYL